MFSRLSDTTKKYIVNSMAAIAIVLFVVAFFIGRDMEDQDKQRKEQSKSGSEEEELEAEDPSVQEEHSHEEYEYEDPAIGAIPLETIEEPVTQAALHSVVDVEASKKATEQFIRYFYPFNGEEPLNSINQSKPYMTEGLFQQYINQPARPTHHTFKKKLTGVEIREPFEPSSEYIAWDILVSGIVEDSEGNQVKETQWFLIKTEKVESEYKVSALALNKPH